MSSWPRIQILALGANLACAGTKAPPTSAAAPTSAMAPTSAAAPTSSPSELVSEPLATTATTAAVAPAQVETAPPAPARPRTEPLKLLILGDSMAATDFGHALEQVLSTDPRISTARKGKSSTGLARPDFFDWMEEGPKQVERHRPDLVLVILGGNDGQDLLARKPGARVFWGSPSWPEAYAERLRTLSRRLGSDRRPVIFLGLPLMDRPRLEKKLKLIRSVQAETLADEPGTHYLDTRSCFVGKRGKLLVEVLVPGAKKPQPLRQEDGIHLTVAGARHFANCVAELLKPILDESPSPEA